MTEQPARQTDCFPPEVFIKAIRPPRCLEVARRQPPGTGQWRDQWIFGAGAGGWIT